ncbi:MAG: hypothetical protein NWE89_07070 [Candidatus Bathyarchaeota archaeon]|nr:hypothetical protein [Candidatus Bathyarchaeota archaeon]
MGKILLSLDDETDKKFREITIRLFGNKKGALSIAGEQAIREWIVRNDTQIRF